jgi:predicted RNA binding protein YcfA (HicA-like mRNA interferase family)
MQVSRLPCKGRWVRAYARSRWGFVRFKNRFIVEPEPLRHGDKPRDTSPYRGGKGARTNAIPPYVFTKILTPYVIPHIIRAGGCLVSKWDKLIARICHLSKDLRFDELRKVLESCGYEMTAPKSGSSHYTFRKRGCQPITIPKHEPIKKVYVELVKQIVESEAGRDENA